MNPKQVIENLQGAIGVINFWANGRKVTALGRKLSDLMLLPGVDDIAEKSDTLVTEIAAPAKKRHSDLLQ